MGEEAVYTVAEVADQFGVSRWLVREWIKSGKLTATDLRGRRGYVIRAGDLQAFREAMFSSTQNQPN